MEANDIVVLEVDGEGKFGEHYLIGRLQQREPPFPADVPLWLDVVGNDQDRTTAFAKARELAGGRDVFFTQRGRPGHLQDHYNYLACPKCGMYTKGFEVLTMGNSAQSMRCHACKHPLEITIKDP